MGTSKGYEAPTTPQWAKVKADITQAVQLTTLEPGRIGSLLGKYVHANGGPAGMASGAGAIGSGKSAQRVAQNLGALSQRAAAVGFRGALGEAGLDNAETASPSEVTTFLTNFLSGSAATIDDADARAALARLFREILENVEPDAVDDAFEAALQPEAIAATMNAYFGHYLFEQFCRVAYDKLVAKVGDVRADAFLGEIRRFIAAKVREVGATRDLSRINWNSPEGSALATDLFANVLTIFGGGD
jgi:hypothetical protein